MITFKARVRGHLIKVLDETKLDANQTLSKPGADGWCQLTAKVRDTWQLKWWVLAQEDNIEVIGPAGLWVRKGEAKGDGKVS